MTELQQQVENAFGYRGFVTVTKRDGAKLVGFIYDRGDDYLEMYDESAVHRIRLALSEVSDVALTGDDIAQKSHDQWARRHGKLEPASTSAWGDWEAEADRPVLLVTALPLELRLLARVLGGTVRGRLGDQRAVAVAVGMAGSPAAAIAAERPRLVISCGFAGALDPAVATGDIVLASSVHDDAGEAYRAPTALLAAARRALAKGATSTVHEGELLCTTAVLASVADKQAHVAPGRIAVDLESAPVARAAAHANIPWLAVRAVLDPADVALPAFTSETHRSYVMPALRYALGTPRGALDLAQLAWRARTASRALAAALTRLAPALGTRASQPIVREVTA